MQSVADWYDFARDVGGLLVTELVIASAYIQGDQAVMNMAIDRVREQSFDAAASTLGIASPVPRTGAAIKAANMTEEIVSAARAVDRANLEKQAADLIPANSMKHRVTLRSEKEQLEVDLAGKDHRGIPMPHNAPGNRRKGRAVRDPSSGA